MRPKSDPLEVVAAILKKDDKLLVAQRPPDDRLAYQWEFPGGKIEKGETPENALIREIREELNVHIRVLDHFLTVDYLEPPVPLRLHAYWAHLLKGEPFCREHNAIQWITYSQLQTFDFAPADQPVVRKLINLYATNPEN